MGWAKHWAIVLFFACVSTPLLAPSAEERYQALFAALETVETESEAETAIIQHLGDASAAKVERFLRGKTPQQVFTLSPAVQRSLIGKASAKQIASYFDYLRTGEVSPDKVARLSLVHEVTLRRAMSSLEGIAPAAEGPFSITRNIGPYLAGAGVLMPVGMFILELLGKKDYGWQEYKMALAAGPMVLVISVLADLMAMAGETGEKPMDPKMRKLEGLVESAGKDGAELSADTVRELKALPLSAACREVLPNVE